MATDTTTTEAEPVATDTTSDAAGSLRPEPAAPPSQVADLLRAAACALLTVGCIATPESAAIIAPFVPVLVAIRLLRTRIGARRFLVSATLLTLAGVIGAAQTQPMLAWGLATAMLLVPGLGMLHARAALRDPVVAPDAGDWPEPRLTSGMSLALGGWVLALLLVTAVAAPYVESPRQLIVDRIEEAYEPIERECRDGGDLDSIRTICEAELEQRDRVLEAVEPHAAEVLAVFLAIFAFGAALTAHPIVVARTWRTSPRVRPTWRLRELEVHFVAAYLAATGLVGWLLADGEATSDTLLRCTALFVGTLGGLLLVTQGIGLAAWLLTRVRTPGWYRAFLAIGAVLFWYLTVPLLLAFGVFDMAVRPRRRAAAKTPPAG